MRLLEAIKVIRDFINNDCSDLYTSTIVVKKDGARLMTDWGYFEDGLNEIEKWATENTEEVEE